MTTKENDGDYQFNLAVEQPYKKLLNGVNNNRVNGMIDIEIVPRDQINNPSVQIPKKCDRIEACGAWLTDNLHPAWKVKIL
ncbi:MAG: hypothetical protein WCF23_24500 [Candidatus Nitrosopolaris sp.]